MSSTYTSKLKLSIFGESHGEGIGCVLDGVPAGIAVDMDAIRAFLARRAPGAREGMGEVTTTRREPDMPRFFGGIYRGHTTGAPIAAVIENTNTRSGDYASFASIPRPGHADYTAAVKYGGYADMRGGGHFSGRLTAPLCIAGAICLAALGTRGITVGAHILSVGGVYDIPFDGVALDAETLARLDTMAFPTQSGEAGVAMQACIRTAHGEGDSVGGSIECAVLGLPVGLGEPMFDGMENRIARLLFAIPALKGVSFGASDADEAANAFAFTARRGSKNNDAFVLDGGKVKTKTNYAGGILGGITNGMPLLFRAGLKPTPSIARVQRTLDMEAGRETELQITGRHDPCVVLRAVPCVIAAAAIAVYDALLEYENH